MRAAFVVFDLDGTLIDGYGAIGDALAFAMERLILEATGTARYFLEIAGPDAGTPAKPDPSMLRRLMGAAGAEPGRTVVVGDMEVDFEFGRAAECRVVLVPGGSRSREELERVPADALLSRLAELPAWLAARG